MTAVSVLVPWRPTPDRAPVWAALRARWATAHPAWEVVEGICPDGPWCKGIAVADALSRADGDLLVVADADVWCDGVAAAVERVRQGAGWAVPHHEVLRLSEAATARLVAGPWPTSRSGLSYEERPYVGHPGGGMVVLARAAYEAAPIDPRFTGWGHEDDAWAVALRRLVGREWRGVDDLLHLWHRPQPRTSREAGSDESRQLWLRYGRARDAAGMRALVDEFRVSA